jgi:hypothetical protein
MKVENNAVALPRPNGTEKLLKGRESRASLIIVYDENHRLLALTASRRFLAWFRFPPHDLHQYGRQICLLLPVFFAARVNKAASGSGLPAPKRPARFPFTALCSTLTRDELYGLLNVPYGA